MGDVHSSFSIFLDFWLRSSRHEKDFLPELSKLSQKSMAKIFIFQMSRRWFSWQPKGGMVYTPPKSRGVFSDILATANRLNTMYGLQTWYAKSSRQVEITQKVLRHIRHFWRIYDVINVGFFRHFAVFCYRKCHKVCRNSRFSHRICNLIGFSTLPSLMCNWLCVVEL